MKASVENGAFWGLYWGLLGLELETMLYYASCPIESSSGYPVLWSIFNYPLKNKFSVTGTVDC